MCDFRSNKECQCGKSCRHEVQEILSIRLKWPEMAVWAVLCIMMSGVTAGMIAYASQNAEAHYKKADLIEQESGR